MCFQRTSDLPRAQTENLFHLRLECMGHVEQDGYHGLIALELVTRLEELGLDDFKWIKPEIIRDAEKAKKFALTQEWYFDIIRLGEIVRSNLIIW